MVGGIPLTTTDSTSPLLVLVGGVVTWCLKQREISLIASFTFFLLPELPNYSIKEKQQSRANRSFCIVSLMVNKYDRGWVSALFH